MIKAIYEPRRVRKKGFCLFELLFIKKKDVWSDSSYLIRYQVIKLDCRLIIKIFISSKHCQMWKAFRLASAAFGGVAGSMYRFKYEMSQLTPEKQQELKLGMVNRQTQITFYDKTQQRWKVSKYYEYFLEENGTQLVVKGASYGHLITFQSQGKRGQAGPSVTFLEAPQKRIQYHQFKESAHLCQDETFQKFQIKIRSVRASEQFEKYFFETGITVCLERRLGIKRGKITTKVTMLIEDVKKE